MTSAQLLRHDRSHRGRGRAPGGSHRGRCLPRLIEPEELTLFSDRLDDARDYERTLRDFVLARDLTHSADDYDS
jgi:hypothetical protein